jgi:hypothetical protein
MQPIFATMSFPNELVVMTSKILAHIKGGTELVIITSYIVFFAHITY